MTRGEYVWSEQALNRAGAGMGRGTYLALSSEHATAAACEQVRRGAIALAKESTHLTLISTCAPGNVKLEMNGYFKSEPATPAPPVYDEKPLPPSAPSVPMPSKPRWEEMS